MPRLRNFVYPRVGGFAPHFRTLATHELAESNAIRNYQAGRVLALLLHCRECVPYYYECLPTPKELRDDPEGALKTLPLLDKTTLRDHFHELQAKDTENRRTYRNTSGGSTGEPATFVQDANYRRWSRAVTHLFDRWSGYAVGQKRLVLWGAPQDLSKASQVRSRLVGAFKNTRMLDSYDLSPEQMRNYLHLIGAERPTQLLAYAESVAALAQYAEANDIQVEGVGAVMTSAGTLTPEMRAVVQRVFQAPVFNRYGSREVSDIACECPAHEGLHVSPLTHYVELLDEQGHPVGPGETGEVVITLLTNHSMPLLRYRIGDMATWAEEPCSCGRNWPLLTSVEGRTTDHFVGRNGKLVYGSAFRHLLFYEDWIAKYQWIQEDRGQVRLLICPHDRELLHQGLSDHWRENLEQRVSEFLDDPTRLSIELVTDIAPTASGKFRYTMSKLREQ